jgi:hypothetical protein
MMKALITLSLLLSVSTHLSAQIATGPAAGFLLSAYTQKTNGTKVSRIGTKAIPSLRIGGFVEYALDKRWRVQSGLYYAGNGHYWEDPASSLVRWFSIRTIECPLLLTWHGGMQRQTHFFAGAGVVAAHNFGGFFNTGNTDALGNILPRTERKLKIGSDDTAADIRPYTWSAMVKVGVQMKNGIRAEARWMQGVTNIVPEPAAQVNTLRGYQFGLTIAYVVGGKTSKERKSHKAKPKPSY